MEHDHATLDPLAHTSQRNQLRRCQTKHGARCAIERAPLCEFNMHTCPRFAHRKRNSKRRLLSAARQERNKKAWFGVVSVGALCGRLTIGRVLKEERRLGSGTLGRSDGRSASRQEQGQGREEGHSWDRFTLRVLGSCELPSAALQPPRGLPKPAQRFDGDLFCPPLPVRG